MKTEVYYSVKLDKLFILHLLSAHTWLLEDETGCPYSNVVDVLDYVCDL